LKLAGQVELGIHLRILVKEVKAPVREV
jgi:hypothetical protein